ncbi:2-amino-4-hydroxy-6-hydroxymethyldihydropteridine diphosphokinase [Albidovulum sp.]|uniref:2-amino-4-hydroxy-6- hydroxymethyldihydropteridine diphosphokinase n=1 Tax=Albidovulum sp. TaxID=1872424 RepID=UPI0039B933E7
MSRDFTSIQRDRLAAIALGGNSPTRNGGPAETIVAALADMACEGVIVAVSRFFRTPAYPPGSGPDFVNVAALLRTALAPGPLLAALHAIEARYGRERLTRWGERTLDIDLLAVEDRILPDEATLRHWMDLAPARQRVEAPDRLILPHPRLHERAFVLIPLAEIAPGWRHPLTGRTVAEMAAALPEADKSAICPL